MSPVSAFGRQHHCYYCVEWATAPSERLVLTIIARRVSSNDYLRQVLEMASTACTQCGPVNTAFVRAHALPLSVATRDHWRDAYCCQPGLPDRRQRRYGHQRCRCQLTNVIIIIRGTPGLQGEEDMGVPGCTAIGEREDQASRGGSGRS